MGAPGLRRGVLGIAIAIAPAAAASGLACNAVFGLDGFGPLDSGSGDDGGLADGFGDSSRTLPDAGSEDAPPEAAAPCTGSGPCAGGGCCQGGFCQAGATATACGSSCTNCVAFCPTGATCTCAQGDQCGGTKTFSYTGSDQTFAVPAGVTQLTIAADGAAGGGAQGFFGFGEGGLGGSVTATIPVTSGELLTIEVGGVGSSNGATTNAGGFNGGGASNQGGSGGGASDVRRGGTALANRVVVAAGGGGTGTGNTGTLGNGIGGGGGNQVGGAGNNGSSSAVGGGGGTQSAGGVGGSGQVNGQPGTLGIGGSVGTGSNSGAGGGGYYGGGSGGSANPDSGSNAPPDNGGGGGGSSYVEPSATGVLMSAGVHSGNGQVVISW